MSMSLELSKTNGRGVRGVDVHQEPPTHPTAMGAKEPVLLHSREGVITRLHLNRPEQMNCLSEALLAALERALREIAEDDGVKCIVLSAAGRAFCAGHDLREMQANSSVDYYRGLFANCSRVMQCLSEARVPVIAKVHGDATAAGCQLVAACDMVVASTKARFGAPGINLGSYCATPAVAITRKIPPIRAFDLLFTGRLIDASTAASWGLINEAVEPGALDGAVDSLANVIASKSGEALRFGKSQFYRQREMLVGDAYKFASEGIASSLASNEAVEGIDAFLTKRAPVWKT